MIFTDRILAMDPSAFDALIAEMRLQRSLLGTAPTMPRAVGGDGDKIDYEVSPRVHSTRGLEKPVRVDGSIAHVFVRGPLVKQDNFWVRYFGFTSTATLRQTIEEAMANRTVGGILLHIESPGGSVFGTGDLADTIRAARDVKPVYAYIEDIGASAAYWIASQADRIFTNPTALTPAIGTYMVIDDWSKWFEDKGIKTHVVRAGKFKGAGEVGAKITEEQLADFQREIDSLNQHFVAGVAKGRRMSIDKVVELADGRVYVGAEAQRLGLIDGVQSLELTIRQLQQEISSSGPGPFARTPYKIAAGSAA